MLLIHNQNTDPYYNMALEEYFLTGFEEEFIILWRNAPCIVVGKNQNTIDEINVDFVERHVIPVVRRLSGGGAVFHDLGNLNYTIIENDSQGKFSDFAAFTGPVCRFLNDLGVPAKVNGRNDITADGCKISGSAQTLKNGRLLHHGTLLFNSDLTRIAGALRPNPVKYQSKGVASVRSRVANIADFMKEPLDIQTFAVRLFQYFQKENHSCTVYEVTEEDAGAVRQLEKSKYLTWAWNYGKSPSYNFSQCRRYSFGTVEVRALAEHGIIRQASVYGDFFGDKDKCGLEEFLRGKTHSRKELREAFGGFQVDDYISGMTADEFVDLLV